MKLMKYSFKRLANYDYFVHNLEAPSYLKEGHSEAEMVVRINGRDLYARSMDYEVPERYVRRKLEDHILNEIRRELFGNV